MLVKKVPRVLVIPVSTGLFALSLTACTASAPEGNNPPPSTDADGTAVTAGSEQPSQVNEVDLHFIAMMTPHHQQAVDMSDIILSASETTDETNDLAERIKQGQQAEIDTMVGWANTWEQDALMAHHAEHVANGMLTPAQLDELETLDGPEADTQFLQLMHMHHEGAIAMTEDQIENGGYTPLVELAEQMVEVQTAEMDEMEQLLTARGEDLLTD